MTNRIIKFRAWDRSTKKMLLVVNVKEGFRELSKDQITTSQCFDEGCDFLTPMQFTGRHDKNGKEIWEGDVVRVLHRRWSEYKGEMELLDDTVGAVVWDDQYAQFDVAGGDFATDIIEVIGNIYENPELLT